MSQAEETPTTRSVTVKIRCPREVIATIEEWAVQHQVSRSEAVRILALRGMALTA